jgi:hypothetical protein
MAIANLIKDNGGADENQEYQQGADNLDQFHDDPPLFSVIIMISGANANLFFQRY